jgi:homoserine kinase
VISGAGPTVLALTDAAAADAVLALAGPDWAAHRLELDHVGAAVLPLAADREQPQDA